MNTEKTMQHIIVQPRNQEEFQLVTQLMKRMKIKSIVTEETPKQKKKREILDDLEQSVQDMNDHFAGRKQFKTARQVLDEL